MLREEQYHKLAEEYQCGIGIAEWEESVYGRYSSVKSIPDEMRVIILTNHMIREGIYQKGIKEVMRLERKYGNKRINKSTIYEKAINNIVDKD